MEEQNGDHERRTSEEDVGDLLLGVDEVLGNPAIPEEQSIPKENRKGNEDEVVDEVHHVPAPKIKDPHLMTVCGQACHSGWKGNQSLSLELLWMSATPTVFHANQRE